MSQCIYIEGLLTYVAIGRGNEIVCFAINEVAKRIVGMEVEPIFADMGKFWSFRETSREQHRSLTADPDSGVGPPAPMARP